MFGWTVVAVVTGLMSGGVHAPPAIDTGPIVADAVVTAPVAEVWKALATKEGQESWNVAHAEVDLRVGGKMRTHYKKEGALGDAGTIENTILCYDPERMISIKVTKFPAGFPFPAAVQSMWTVLYFEAVDANSTRVTCRGLGFTADPESQKLRRFFQAGNKQTMDELAAHFKRSAGSHAP